LKTFLFLVTNVCSFTIYFSARSTRSVPMTKRKSGLPADDHASSGVTSMCNKVSGTDKRAAALAMDKALKRAQRYDTLTLTDLASWPSLLVYETLPQRLKDHVFEYYMWQQLHANSSITREQVKQAFESLNNHEHDTLTEQLCDKHAVIEYTLRSQVLPEYIAHHVTSGSQTVHWQSVSPGSRIHKRRQRVVQRMVDLRASSIVPGARGQVIDFYGWRLDDDDTGMLHMLLRDLPSATKSTKRGSGDDDEDDEDDDDDDDDKDDDDVAATKPTSKSKSALGIASAYVRAMHTAVVVLQRAAHPRSVLCPISSAERSVLVNTHGIPEDLLQGQKVVPQFKYSTAATDIKDAWSFLVSCTSSFFRDVFLSDAYFALRALKLARGNVKPGASLAAVHKECRRVWGATSNAARAGFDHGLTTVHNMLQHSKDLFEPDAAALLAIQSLLAGAGGDMDADKGRLLNSEVRRQLALYHRELVAAARKRRNTIAVAGNLDAGGLDGKVAGGRLPRDISLITVMIAHLWSQVWQTTTWAKVVVPYLQQKGVKCTVQSFLRIEAPGAEMAEMAEQAGFTPVDGSNLRTLLQLELSFLRSQVWREALVAEFKLIEHNGEKMYEFRTRRAFKTAGRAARGDLPAATRWPLSSQQSALVHTILHTASSGSRIFKATSGDAVRRTFQRLGFNWLGIPRLGPHAMRSYKTYMAVNDSNVSTQDYPALASRMQVSVDTMTSVYVAPSMRSPAAQLALRLNAAAEDAQAQCLTLSQQQQPQVVVQQEQAMPPQQQQQQAVPPQQQQQQQQKEAVMQSGPQQQQQTAVYPQQQYASQQQQYMLQQQLQMATAHQRHRIQQQQPQRGMIQEAHFPLYYCSQQQHLLKQQQQPAMAPRAAVLVLPDLVPYGKALAAVRQSHVPSIKGYFATRGLTDKTQPPLAACVAATFQRLCELRRAQTLPAEALWFNEKQTYFSDSHVTPFKNFVRKMYRKEQTTRS
jgi:hypothetical protein